MWIGWVALTAFAAVHRWRDAAARWSLMMILAGLLVIQPIRMILDQEPGRIAVAMVWAATACLILAIRGGELWRVSLYLAATVPCVFVGRVLPIDYGPTNPGVILSHIFGTLAILEAGYGISDRVRGWGLGFGDRAGYSGGRVGDQSGKTGATS